MNIYGDNGNLLVLEARSILLSLYAKITCYNPGDPFPEEVDIVIGGGGQDSGQGTIQDDLLTIAGHLQTRETVGHLCL